jgi:uncharacterized protein YigA (DUF484 family)
MPRYPSDRPDVELSAALPAITPAQAEAFLRANPRFLAENPGLYGALAPPVRVHGDVLADHMAAILGVERSRTSAMADRADLVLATGRAAAGLAARVQEAVLALIRADNVADCVAAELPALLAIDAACLCLEDELPGARKLPAGSVRQLLGSRAVLFRQGAADAPLLHGEAARLARHDALVLVPGEGPPALLALVARDGHALGPAQGTGALAFLGRAVAAALER